MRIAIPNAVSMKTKLLLLILFFLCFPLLIFGMMWYVRSTEAIEKNAIGYSEQLVQQINSQLDWYFADVERITYPLLLNPQIQSFMKLDPSDQFERFLISSKISEELFPSIIFGRPDIYGLSIVSKSGIATASYNTFAAKDSYEQYKDELMDDRNYKIMGLSYKDSTPVLTISRKFMDTLSYRSAGLLIVHLRLNEIIHILDKVKLGRTGYVWVMDGGGSIIYHPDKEKWGQAADERGARLKFGGSSGYSVDRVDGEKRLVIFHRSKQTGWTLVSEVPLHELNEDMISLRNMTVWIGLLLVGLALLLVAGYSLRATRSLSHLQRLMRKAEEGDLAVRAPENRRDEIGQLNHSFNKMVKRIYYLIEEVHSSRLKEKEMEIRQRESALQAMQSQINPHFLYNTLEIINSYALVEGVRPISRMTAALSDIFRYSTGHPRQTVTLGEEIRHTGTYLDIQRERFKALETEIKLDGSLLEQVPILRLTVQPIVENAFKHGYQAHKLKPTYIGISGELHEWGFAMRIEDRGRGMEPERRAAYNEAFLAENSLSGSSFEAIGLWNVHQRLRLVFGPPYGLYIVKSDAGGTIVELRLRYEGEGPASSISL
ncbi:cache domain-containing protein [Paenibacillus filicis]|uniref:Cache domain-containing protein n=1 Tax=Paenibacillus gyeongsangnamensis TaxID=3388067 RepID=A0ABT4QEZ9_9BACL|nr:sensor histidine kinase [Paenibacillus filicis]MCZ8515432.1 cache domain-containing protein [Paenibacillus filicis]